MAITNELENKIKEDEAERAKEIDYQKSFRGFMASSTRVIALVKQIDTLNTPPQAQNTPVQN